MIAQLVSNNYTLKISIKADKTLNVAGGIISH